MQTDSLPVEPQGKPKNTGEGSLSLLQWIFLTQNWTGVSCIVGIFFTIWATREALYTHTHTYTHHPEIYTHHPEIHTPPTRDTHTHIYHPAIHTPPIRDTHTHIHHPDTHTHTHTHTYSIFRRLLSRSNLLPLKLTPDFFYMRHKLTTYFTQSSLI